MSETVRTTCPYCGVGCGVLATPRADGTVEIKGDPDHPANFGRLCSKGSALGETLGGHDRLTIPQIEGRNASWDEALSLVASKFNEAIETYGAESVAFYVSGQILTEDYYVANKLMKGFIGTGNIDTNSRLCMASSVAGHRRAFGTDTVPGTYEDLEEADTIVLVGSNLIWCHPVLYQRIAAVKEKRPDLKVILVDPRRTRTADLADMHIDLEADSDAALFNGLLNHIEADGLIDHDYVNAHVAGSEAALAEARQWPLDAVSAATGLSAEKITAFYNAWCGSGRVVTAYSQGVNQSVVGTDKVNAIINCHLATGRIGKIGAGPFSLTGQPNAMGGREVGGLANMLAAHMNIENAAHRDLVQTFWNAPRMAQKPGLKAVDMFRAVKDGRIKALWIMATNPVVSMPEAGDVEAAIANCPFVVVSDVVGETDTLRYAHVKLPSLGWGEKDGTVTNSERRISRQRAFLPAMGEGRADWWQMAEVGKRMGYAQAFDYADASEIYAEYAALTATQNNGARDLDLGAHAAIDKASYDALTPFQWPLKAGDEPQPNSRFFADGGFFTEDKKAKMLAITPPFLKAPKLASEFRLNTGRVRDHWHTMTRTGRAARLSSHLAEPYCELHPADAETLAIADADLVRLSNSHGQIHVRALISEGQKPGNVFVPIHWNDQFASEGRVDKLVDGRVDGFSGQPASKGSKVLVEKADMGFQGFAVSREKPNTFGLDYWALARAVNGWRIEFAMRAEPLDKAAFLSGILAGAGQDQSLSADDAHHGFWRFASFDGEALQGAAYFSRGQVAVSRSWASDQLSGSFASPKDRWRVLAGRPAADATDKGAIVCACMGVGANEIAEAVRGGATSVDAIGKCTSAGTNCGSCRAEIQEIIHAHHLIAAE